MKANREVIADLAADVSVLLNYNAVFDTWQAMIPRNAIIVSEGANSNTTDIGSTTPVHLEQWVWVGLLLYIPNTQILKKKGICIEGGSALGFRNGNYCQVQIDHHFSRRQQ